MHKFSLILLIFFFLILSYLFGSFFEGLRSFIPYLLGLVMFGMGMTLKINELKTILKKPLWIITTIFLQFSVMPLLAFLIVYIFKFPKEIALGFIILGSCPGGTASNVIAYICKANLSLSIFCTFASTGLAVLLTPTIIYFFADESISIDITNLIKSTFYIIFLPVSAGLLIKIIIKEDQVKLLKFFPFFSEIAIAVIIAIIFSLNFDSLDNVTFLIILGVMAHNLLGLFLGLFISSLLKFPEDVRKTVAIEVAMQNSGLGMTLALMHFTKLVALPSALFSLWHNISASGLVYLWKKK